MAQVSQNMTATGGCWPSSWPRRKDSRPDVKGLEPDQLVQELNELSVEEREVVFEEIHGICERQSETPEFLEACFSKLEFALSHEVSKKKRKAYDRAVFLKPSLPKDRPFQLLFLRAFRYDAIVAAMKMCRYFENKRLLWGEERLARALTLDDLSPAGMAALMTGYKHNVGRDRVGRLVWYSTVTTPYPDGATTEGFSQSVWYQFMAAVEDDEANQTAGMIEVVNAHGANPTARSESLEFFSRYGGVLATLPIRFAAIHYNHEDMFMEVVMKVLQNIMGRDNRVRFRSHYGSMLESRYALLTFGIDVPAATSESTASLRQQIMDDYVKERRQKESSFSDTYLAKAKELGVACIFPSSNDVLCGRGHPYHTFAGVRILHELVDANLSKYLSATGYMAKSVIAREVVDKIQEKGGRFLQRVPDKGWNEVDEVSARKRVSNAFRMREIVQAKKEYSSGNHVIDDDDDDDGDGNPATSVGGASGASLVSISASTSQQEELDASSDILGAEEQPKRVRLE